MNIILEQNINIKMIKKYNEYIKEGFTNRYPFERIMILINNVDEYYKVLTNNSRLPHPIGKTISTLNKNGTVTKKEFIKFIEEDLYQNIKLMFQKKEN